MWHCCLSGVGTKRWLANSGAGDRGLMYVGVCHDLSAHTTLPVFLNTNKHVMLLSNPGVGKNCRKEQVERVAARVTAPLRCALYSAFISPRWKASEDGQALSAIFQTER